MWIQIKSKFDNVSKGAGEVAYHILVVAFSAWAAIALPHTAGVAAQAFATYLSVAQRDETTLVAVEITFAILLMVCLNYLRQNLRNRKLAGVATRAGLTEVFSPVSPPVRKTIRHLKTHQGRAKHVMILGSTGYNTFVDPSGDLHTVIWKCLEAKVMLLNPFSEAAYARASAILAPTISHEGLVEQIRRSIELCKQLKAGQKSIRLKLYSDPPHIKLAILGNAIWLQHYHTGLDVHVMPEYLFQLNHHDYGLYTLFYQYFTKRWESPEIPEYDLETDELVYRGKNGHEIKRESFPLTTGMSAAATPDGTHFQDMGLQDR